jgi:hypothetical protein
VLDLGRIGKILVLIRGSFSTIGCLDPAVCLRESPSFALRLVTGSTQAVGNLVMQFSFSMVENRYDQGSERGSESEESNPQKRLPAARHLNFEPSRPKLPRDLPPQRHSAAQLSGFVASGRDVLLQL